MLYLRHYTPCFIHSMLYLPFYTCFSPLSLRHYVITPILMYVLLSIYPHFFFSFYPCFTPKHDRLNKTRRLVLLLFLTVLHSFKIRITVGFFFLSVLQCYISIKNQCQPLVLSCFLGDFFRLSVFLIPLRSLTSCL